MVMKRPTLESSQLPTEVPVKDVPKRTSTSNCTANESLNGGREGGDDESPALLSKARCILFLVKSLQETGEDCKQWPLTRCATWLFEDNASSDGKNGGVSPKSPSSTRPSSSTFSSSSSVQDSDSDEEEEWTAKPTHAFAWHAQHLEGTIAYAISSSASTPTERLSALIKVLFLQKRKRSQGKNVDASFVKWVYQEHLALVIISFLVAGPTKDVLLIYRMLLELFYLGTPTPTIFSIAMVAMGLSKRLPDAGSNSRARPYSLNHSHNNDECCCSSSWPTERFSSLLLVTSSSTPASNLRRLPVLQSDTSEDSALAQLPSLNNDDTHHPPEFAIRFAILAYLAYVSIEDNIPLKLAGSTKNSNSTPISPASSSAPHACNCVARFLTRAADQPPDTNSLATLRRQVLNEINGTDCKASDDEPKSTNLPTPPKVQCSFDVSLCASPGSSCSSCEGGEELESEKPVQPPTGESSLKRTRHYFHSLADVHRPTDKLSLLINSQKNATDPFTPTKFRFHKGSSAYDQLYDGSQDGSRTTRSCNARPTDFNSRPPPLDSVLENSSSPRLNRKRAETATDTRDMIRSLRTNRALHNVQRHSVAANSEASIPSCGSSSRPFSPRRGAQDFRESLSASLARAYAIRHPNSHSSYASAAALAAMRAQWRNNLLLADQVPHHRHPRGRAKVQNVVLRRLAGPLYQDQHAEQHHHYPCLIRRVADSVILWVFPTPAPPVPHEHPDKLPFDAFLKELSKNAMAVLRQLDYQLNVDQNEWLQQLTECLVRLQRHDDHPANRNEFRGFFQACALILSEMHYAS